MIEPMIPGNAAAALPASRPKSLARALSLFLIHSPILLGFLGGVVDPPVAAPPVRDETIVEMIKPSDVSTAVIVKPCSLRISLSFSFKFRSSSRIFSIVCLILETRVLCDFD